MIDKLEDNTSKRTKLKELCRTRWVERHDAFEVFIDFLPAILGSIEHYSHLPNTRTPGAADASSLYNSVTRFDFIISLVIVYKCLAYVRGLSKSLQQRSLDIGRAFQQVTLVKSCLEDTRNEVEEFHSKCFEQATKLSSALDIPVTKPRTCKRQTKRDNMPAETIKDYFRMSITIPFLDHLISQMDTRFSNLHERALIGLKLVPSMLTQTTAAFDFSFFNDDMPSSSALDVEIQQWTKMWSETCLTEKPASIQDGLSKCDSLFFPNIKTILRISAIFPVTSCECERSISTLRLLKTYLRSTMSQDRLTSLALMYIHSDIELNPSDIVSTFSRKQPRKMLLPNILFDQE